MLTTSRFDRFPYYTKSLKLAALHYTLIGKLMEIMEVKENSSILELGFGWGNTTLALAMLGHKGKRQLTSRSDICELVRRRAQMLRVEISIINADFSMDGDSR